MALGFAACNGTVGARGPGAGGAGSDTGAGSGTGTAATTGTGSTTGAGGATSGPGAGGATSGPGTGGASSAQTPVTFACNAAAKAPVSTLRRLTMTQYRNTVADLVSWAMGGASAGQPVLTAVAAQLDGLPDDHREAVPQDLHGSYRRLDQSLQQIHVDATYDLATAVGAALTTSARLGTVVGSCATDTNTSNDAACLDTFIKKFGPRALRRPLAADEVDFYKTAYGASTAASAAAYADLIGVFLTAPDFMYFVEHGGAAVAGQTGVYEVSAPELASRLSYQLWQTAPDDALMATATDGSLLTDGTYRAQIARLLADPRAKSALDEFFADWTKVEDLPPLDAKNQDVVFKAFAGTDLPNASLRQAMIDDVVGLLGYYTWTSPAGIGEIFSTDRSFARDARLAKIYGVPAWDGGASPPMLPAGQRPGLLTRALFLASGSANTRPIMKGVFARTNILCDQIGPPPPGANAKPPELGPGMTTRESVEAITEMTGTVCASCHESLINPLGFATEGFDALGRVRTEQRLFDAAGTQIGTKPVNTTTVPRVSLTDATAVSTPGELMGLIGASGKVEACLARHFFRFTYARWENLTTDGCALESARAALVGGGSGGGSASGGSGKITDLITATLTAPQFRQRTFQ